MKEPVVLGCAFAHPFFCPQLGDFAHPVLKRYAGPVPKFTNGYYDVRPIYSREVNVVITACQNFRQI